MRMRKKKRKRKIEAVKKGEKNSEGGIDSGKERYKKDIETGCVCV